MTRNRFFLFTAVSVPLGQWWHEADPPFLVTESMIAASGSMLNSKCTRKHCARQNMFALQSAKIKDIRQCGIVVQPCHFRIMGCVY